MLCVYFYPLSIEHNCPDLLTYFTTCLLSSKKRPLVVNSMTVFFKIHVAALNIFFTQTKEDVLSFSSFNLKIGGLGAGASSGISKEGGW